MGNIYESQKNMTIADIAEELGVSKTTISRAISGKGRISEATRERVAKCIKAHDYKPNVIAQSLAQSKTYNVCVTLPGDYNLADLPFFQSALVGICEYLSQRNYDVVVTNTTGENIKNLTRIISNRKVDGVIVTRTMTNGHDVEYLEECKIPFLTIGSHPDQTVVQVDSNHEEGCREMTDIILMKGIRKIALIGGDPNHIVSQNRYRGFEQAHKKAKIKINKNLVFEGITSEVAAMRAVESAIFEQAECIICMDDNICGYVLKKLNELGLKIPEDIKVASFFGSNLLKNHVPAISSIEFNTLELGMTAAKVILDMIDGIEAPQKTMLGYNVVLRESTK